MASLLKKLSLEKRWCQAVLKKDTAAMKAVLAEGFDVNKSFVLIKVESPKSKRSLNALQFCAFLKQEDMMRFLIENGGNPDDVAFELAERPGQGNLLKKVLDEFEAEFESAYRGLRRLGTSCRLDTAVRSGDCDRVRDIFRQAAFEENLKFFPDWGHLRTAMERGDEPMMKLLVAWGVEIPPNVVGLGGMPAEKLEAGIKVLRREGKDVRVLQEALAAKKARSAGNSL